MFAGDHDALGDLAHPYHRVAHRGGLLDRRLLKPLRLCAAHRADFARLPHRADHSSRPWPGEATGRRGRKEPGAGQEWIGDRKKMEKWWVLLGPWESKTIKRRV